MSQIPLGSLSCTTDPQLHLRGDTSKGKGWRDRVRDKNYGSGTQFCLDPPPPHFFIADLRPCAGNRIWCILALKCDIWWTYFSNFPDNQLNKCRVLIGWSRIFFTSPPLKFLRSISLRQPIGWTPLTDATHKRATRQTEVSLCLFVCLSVCILDGVWHLTRAAGKTTIWYDVDSNTCSLDGRNLSCRLT